MQNKINGISKKNILFKKLSESNERDFAKISIDYFVNLLTKNKKYIDGIHIMTSGDIKLAAKISKII